MADDDDSFDFEEHIDSDEDSDFGKPVECPHCHNPVPHNAILCLYCGESVSPARRRPAWVIYLAIVLIISFLIWLLFRF